MNNRIDMEWVSKFRDWLKKEVESKGVYIVKVDAEMVLRFLGGLLYQAEEIANLQERLEACEEIWQKTMDELSKSKKEVFKLRADIRDLGEI